MDSYLDVSDIWNECCHFLQPLVKRWVYSSHFSQWLGYQEELIDEIIHEAIEGIYKHLKLADMQKSQPVVSIAYHRFIDHLRKDRRMLCFLQPDDFSKKPFDEENYISLEDAVFDEMFAKSLCNPLAQEIGELPKGQMNALQRDLANKIYSGKQPTALQKALLEMRMQLPNNFMEYTRQASLVSLAHKQAPRSP